ncbi:MAG TPA: DUF4147 domain-containing protein [Thermoplasmata archaeon]|nr:DUF4147 domain-containing protein [Thermoplasmata archaeon]
MAERSRPGSRSTERSGAGAPDPLAAVFETAYRGAVQGADAYRGVRAAIRRDGGTVRLGNRFYRSDAFHEVAFVALGSAATSLTLGVVAALDDRITQGFVAGPDPLPPEVPFKSVLVRGRRGFDASGHEVSDSVMELAAGLTDRDLLLLLLSPGVLFDLARPPPGLGDGAWAELLARGAEVGLGATGLAELVRAVGGGAVGGRLGRVTPATVVTLVVARGDRPPTVAGGPTVAVGAEERARVRAALDRIGPSAATSAGIRAAIEAESAPLPPNILRPVVVAEPADALREASQALAEKRWSPKLARVHLPGPPDAVADAFLDRIEEELGSRRGSEPLASEEAAARAADEGIGLPPDWAKSIRLGSARFAGPRPSRGIAVFATTTLDVPEGLPADLARAAFLNAVGTRARRRGLVVGILPTAGAPPGSGPGPGRFLVVGSGSVSSGASGGTPLAMRSGITDIGDLLLALWTWPAEGARRAG